MANLNGTPESLGVTPLAEGEHSRPVRIRAPAWVFDALAQRSAAEVGHLLQTALRGASESAAMLEPVGPLLLTSTTALRNTPVKPARPATGLSPTLFSIVDSLKAGAVAEYDHRERKWMVSDRGGPYAVYKRNLKTLVKAGLIQEADGRYRMK